MCHFERATSLVKYQEIHENRAAGISFLFGLDRLDTYKELRADEEIFKR